MKRWIYAEGDFLGAINVFVPLALRDNSSYVDLKFLAAAQALEALARDGKDIHELSQDDYDARVKLIADSVADKEVAEWAKRKLSSANFMSQRKLIRELYDEIGDFAKALFPKKEKFISRHIDLRNDLTHRNPDAATIDKDGMFYHMNGVVLLCYAAIAVKLGISQERVASLMKESNFRWYLRNKAAELY